MSTTNRYKHLAPNPKSAYRQLFVKGTRIRADALYMAYDTEENQTPEEVAAAFDLPVEAVKEVIAYVESNPPELLADRASEEALMEARGMNDPNYKYHPSPKILSPREKARILRP